jgi:hypothetical protein
MIEWLRIEAARQGLALDDEDFKAIENLLREAKTELAAKRESIPEGTEPRPWRPLWAVEPRRY